MISIFQKKGTSTYMKVTCLRVLILNPWYYKFHSNVLLKTAYMHKLRFFPFLVIQMHTCPCYLSISKISKQKNFNGIDTESQFKNFYTTVYLLIQWLLLFQHKYHDHILDSIVKITHPTRTLAKVIFKHKPLRESSHLILHTWELLNQRLNFYINS